MSEPKYIRFVAGPPKPKTNTWYVVPITDDDGDIGYVAWYAPWRGYAFFPGPNTVFEKHCLRDIANFCESQTRQHRQSRSSHADELPGAPHNSPGSPPGSNPQP